MRNVMIGFFSIVILLLVSLSLTSSSGKTMRQNELDSSLSSAMMSSMESLQKRADNDAKTDLTDQQFIADAIQAALVKTDADATYKVTVYQLDAQKGLLDVGVTAKYAQVMHPGKVSARRCIVLDDYKNDLDEYFTVQRRRFRGKTDPAVWWGSADRTDAATGQWLWKCYLAVQWHYLQYIQYATGFCDRGYDVYEKMRKSLASFAGLLFLQNAFCFWTCFYILYIGKFIRGSAILSATVDVFWDTPGR